MESPLLDALYMSIKNGNPFSCCEVNDVYGVEAKTFYIDMMAPMEKNNEYCWLGDEPNQNELRITLLALFEEAFLCCIIY